MKCEEKIKTVYDRLDVHYLKSRSLLEYTNSFELLIAVLLSAQTTDAKVNEVTPKLWNAFPSVDKLANASVKDIEFLIKEIGLYRNKAKYILANAKLFIENFLYQMPSEMEDLLTFQGVGRKSAHVIRFHIFGLPAIIVDTHFMRVNQRLGLCSETSNAFKIEKEIRANLCEDLQSRYSMIVNYYGRDICLAKKPQCNNCLLVDLCLNPQL